MKRNIRQCLIVAATALSLAACDVKDPIYNTPHPEQGAITLVTDWSGIGAVSYTHLTLPTKLEV